MPAAPRPDQRDPRRTGRAGSRSARRRTALRARHPAPATPRAGARRSCPDQRARTPPGSCAWTGSAPARPRRADPPPASAHLHCWWPPPRSIHPVRWRSTRAPAGRGSPLPRRQQQVIAKPPSRAAVPLKPRSRSSGNGRKVARTPGHADTRRASHRAARRNSAGPPAAPAPVWKGQNSARSAGSSAGETSTRALRSEHDGIAYRAGSGMHARRAGICVTATQSDQRPIPFPCPAQGAVRQSEVHPRRPES